LDLFIFYNHAQVLFARHYFWPKIKLLKYDYKKMFITELTLTLTWDKRGEIVAKIHKMTRLNTVQKREVTSDHFTLQQVVFAHTVLCFVPQSHS
jgi:hypothetical protein